ncbi:MAG: M28 family peptidase, partial [Bacteroidales bacterium]|nr:M28 family peptidase [Bacteroidales bacterium]
GEMTAYNGAKLPVINIVGSFNPDAKMRVLLMSHWDSRPFADNDPDPAKRKQPVMGANDGASGVGILLELARLCSEKLPQVGIDIFLTDAEDYGAPEDWSGPHDEKWWALGTQMWCKQAAKEGYRAQYGILLDMVGSANATFYREYYSERYANSFVNEIWQAAARLGYGDLFINQGGGGVTDDHVFVNRMLQIPCVDIIDTRTDTDGTFCPEWHTTHDTMDNISRETLGKVGRVLVSLLW